MRVVSPSQERAIALGVALVAIWEAWDDAKASELDDAMAAICRETVGLDYAHVDRRLKLALEYFAAAYLNDINPLDWTYCEMLDAIADEIRELASR